MKSSAASKLIVNSSAEFGPGNERLQNVVVFYQYFYPDQNISSVHLSELSAELVERGWNVTAFPCNRDLERPEEALPAREEWRGVRIHRVWRPKISRGSSTGRMFNAAWMIARWSLMALRPSLKPNVLIVGTDPIFSIFVSFAWKLLKPDTKIVHWCFDLYPEAAYADGLLSRNKPAAKALEAAVRHAYKRCDAIVDIGACMQDLLHEYGSTWKSLTLVPWAMSEPPEPLPVPRSERAEIFGPATLGLMYSGTFGRAHSFDDLLQLMQCLEGHPIRLSLSVKGQRESLLRTLTVDAANIAWHPFASRERLESRLAAADIQVVSLREEWTGTVVPSKFFGALAVGRPVLFCGSERSSIARFIREHQLGWVLSPGKVSEVAQEILQLVDAPQRLVAFRERCHAAYRTYFSRRVICNSWHELLLECDPARQG